MSTVRRKPRGECSEEGDLMGSAWSGAQLDPSGVTAGGQTRAWRGSQRERVVLNWTLGAPTSEQPCEVGVVPIYK